MAAGYLPHRLGRIGDFISGLRNRTEALTDYIYLHVTIPYFPRIVHREHHRSRYTTTPPQLLCCAPARRTCLGQR